MKLLPVAHELISNMRAFFQSGNAETGYLDEEPLRAALMSAAQLEKFGRLLAGTHQVSTDSAGDHLIKRLSGNEKILIEVRKLLTVAIKSKQQITPAGEWLIDNFYLIEEHIRIAKTHFPKNYSKDLPQLAAGPALGRTRIYDIVLQIISHSDGRIDIESLNGFIRAYQTVTPLKLGELWAIPIMLRLALIENIRRVSSRVAIDRIDENLANYWASQMIAVAEQDPKNLILEIADMARSNPPMVSAFVSELTRQLRGKGPGLALTLNWIEQLLSENGLTGAELVNTENQKQAMEQVSISNSINGLRLLGAMDWRNFVEKHSIVEQILLEDTDGVYGQMDFVTRDHYRHVIERIAKAAGMTEFALANQVIERSKKNLAAEGAAASSRHVGYYLIGAGLTETESQAGVPATAIRKTKRFLRARTFPLYALSIVFITLLVSTGLTFLAYWLGEPLWVLGWVAFFSLLSVGQLSISMVNFLATVWVRPNLLPRLDFSRQIPISCRTLVVVPAMLSGEDEVETLVEALEVRYLANRQDHLYFALLTDFTDASQEKLEADLWLVDLAQQRIAELNKKYDRPRADLFYLFHRPRFWNAAENVWMGYERKRGKLEELNALLRGGAQDRFSVVTGDQTIFQTIKYVITLDADTQLPLGSAHKLIGTMAHPLNRAWYDPRKRRITAGYGILQPRVAVSLPGSTSSYYARMHGNEPGIDPYTRASSDVYQDLFEEGSFIGKGIYELDIFRKVLDGRFAENGILSHDLLEGCYLRSGLVSDVLLFEHYPGSYQADMTRNARWIRGDWQIFSWIFPFHSTKGEPWGSSPVSGLSRWKIGDNIRRSLIPLALTAFMLLAWLVSRDTLVWTIIVSSIILFPLLLSSLWDVFRKPKHVRLVNHLVNAAGNFKLAGIKTVFMLICLPYEAYLNLKAVLLTLWRMLVSRKKLLEWSPSTLVAKAHERSLLASYVKMWFESLLALSVLVFLMVTSPSKLPVALPVLLLWLSAPLVSWWISRPLAPQTSRLSEEQQHFLQKLARKTWSFFEQFVGIADNWLPPDNFQEQPVAQLAHRTSPTNIGISLLANLTAAGFGYITPAQLITRSRATLETMLKMERYKGHFYNWYDTETLSPLLPRYISTVDSGNLVGHLLILRQGLLAIPNQKLPVAALFRGLKDTLEVLADTISENDKPLLQPFRQKLEAALLTDLGLMETATLQLDILKTAVIKLQEKFENRPEDEVSDWFQKLDQQLAGIAEVFDFYKPWHMLRVYPDKFGRLVVMERFESWLELYESLEDLQTEINSHKSMRMLPAETGWMAGFELAVAVSRSRMQQLLLDIEILGTYCQDFAEVDWHFLYDNTSHLFSIGYNVQDHRMDGGYYDLLASEARLATFIGIAQHKLPEKSWFALGRLLTNVEGNSILLSWSGSMFEYLMPLLVMPTYDNTLLDQTNKAAVAWQIKYGRKTAKPWGISESGFNMLNANSQYQYRAFGAPGLGLKRGLEEDYVIAPYATALALMVVPEKACENLQTLEQSGYMGAYGFYEAIDFTPSRLPRGQSAAIVYSYMAHHQGMSLLSLGYLLLDKPLQKLFESYPPFKAVLLLLQERIPKITTFFAHTTDISDIDYVESGTETRIIHTPHTPLPEVYLLSNGRYHVMITNAGAGYSRWKDLAVTRWREDVTCDNRGTFCYIRDVENDSCWSNTYQPLLQKSDTYEVAFSLGRVDFNTTKNEIESHTIIVVSPEDDIEIRRITLINRSDVKRIIEVTSYAEVVVAPPASDIAQPAFSNLFVQTEIIPVQHAIVCTRRARSAEEKPPWMFQLATIQGNTFEEVSYETDRMAFVGRGNSLANPAMMQSPGPLSGNQGAVLDPIAAIRYRIVLEPDASVTVDMVMGIADTRDACMGLIWKYQDKHHKDRVFELAWTHSQVVLRQINASEADAQLYGRLAGSVLFINPALRADATILINNRRQQSGLWGYSISGDLPIVLVKIEKQENIQLVKQMIQAHHYWRFKGLSVDLVIWNEENNGYRQIFQNTLEAIIPAELKDRPGGIFVRASDQISNEDRMLFQSVARILISDNGGSLADHVKRKAMARVVIPPLVPVPVPEAVQINLPLPEGLLFYNGTGGFSKEGDTYVIVTDEQHHTPLPWVNVIANPVFGTVISESGSAYSWTENAHELRLTPWNNDPVQDGGGEAFYLRDEESGYFWSTSLLPAGGNGNYLTTHGLGYSIFEHNEAGIYSEMTVYVELEAAVKFIVLKVRNESGRSRKISATGYMEWVLGDHRMKTAMHIQTEMDPDSGALIAKNPYNTEFSHRVAFFDVDGPKKTFTADRTEFIGRNGNLRNPEALHRVKLSGKTGLSLDPCAALQLSFDLAPGEEQEVIFRLGASKNLADAIVVAKLFKGSVAAYDALEKVKRYWKKTVGSLQVETPDAATNLMTNGWLTYQTLSARLWGRSGFYQSGGAYGFRDQLQDVVSLLQTAPKLARAQLIRCASRQFKEGDVQHWWHPPVGRGVRTRISDDFLWLPMVAANYIAYTNDVEILDTRVPYLEGRQLNEDEESYYDLPIASETTATLYEHCVQAIRHGLRFGGQGLPLIGTGDWNDGFDKLGREGKGESVWMAFFLYDILIRFSAVARLRGDRVFAEICEMEALQLQKNIDASAWDGNWYKRAWFDNGVPIGSSLNDECKIDSIAQSWSVLSGAADAVRARTAMESAYKYLVRSEAKVIQLLDPPFDVSSLNPGYIKGYVPGIRENGGQYTHAAVWMIMAFARLGDKKRVWELLEMINPVNHAADAETLSVYMAEPYVLAADVYAGNQHAGRGGWTWYTGSAGWMYRLIVESLLGLQRAGDTLRFEPCIPDDWPSFTVHYRFENTVYHILVQQNQGNGEKSVQVDGHLQEAAELRLTSDSNEHQVVVQVYSGVAD